MRSATIAQRDEHYQELLQTDFLQTLSKHQLENITKTVLKTYNARYKRNKKPKSGNINKGYTPYERDVFLSACKNPKAKMACQLMAFLGLRIGETVIIRTEDIDLTNRKIIINTEKSKTKDELHLHDTIYELLLRYLQLHEHKINESGGWLLYSSNHAIAGGHHISQHWLRNHIREITKELGMNYVYDQSTDGRNLNRLTAHSFRHQFGTQVQQSQHDLVLTMRAMRHKDINSTLIYTHMGDDSVGRAVDATFKKGENYIIQEEYHKKQEGTTWHKIGFKNTKR